MEATVNMKMSPAEHRLLVSAVEEAADTAQEIADSKDEEPVVRREARERSGQLSILLGRL